MNRTNIPRPLPTRVELLWHGWRLPSLGVEQLRHVTVRLIDSYVFGDWYTHVPGTVSFDEEPRREVECHLDFEYTGMTEEERTDLRRRHMAVLAPLVGDVMRYFVALDSQRRMLHARLRRGGSESAYGLGQPAGGLAGRETVPFPPSGERHMPRRPLVFDQRFGSN